MKRNLSIALSAAVLLAAAILAAALVLTRPAELPVRSGPNSYPELLEAAQTLHPESAREASSMKPEELKAVVGENAAALARIRGALDRECWVPEARSMADATNHMQELTLPKRVARALIGAGFVAEKEGRVQEAWGDYLYCLELGMAVARDGALIDVLVGLACEQLGRNPLAALVPRLDAADCRAVLARLERAEAKAHTAEEMIQNERAWRNRVYGFKGQWGALFTWRVLRQTEQKVALKIHTERRAARQLLLVMAARAYELEKGRPPASVGDLVPDYLARAPLDPATGAPMGLSPGPQKSAQ